MALSAHVSTVSGQKMMIAEGRQLVFGRGPGVDLAIAAGRGLSRRAGVVTAMPAGAWIANISRTHALYVEGEGYRIRLPRMEDDGEPADGWFVHTGTAYVGSRGMLDDEQPLAVTVTGRFEGWPDGAAQVAGAMPGDGLELSAGAWLDEDWPADEAGLADRGVPADVAGWADGAGGTGGTGGTGGAGLATSEQAGTGRVGGSGQAGGTGQAGTGRGGGSGQAGGTGQAGTGRGGGSGQAGGTGQAGTGRGGGSGQAGGIADGGQATGGGRTGDGTLLPFYIDPMTKLFLVALMWCRPWLLDQSATRPLPRTPEIARGALEVTGAYHELERFDSDPEFRDLLAARVAEHIKVLRRKITDRGLARADVRVSDEVAVRILIEHGIITSADLDRLDDPAWRSRQEDLWWTQSLPFSSRAATPGSPRTAYSPRHRPVRLP